MTILERFMSHVEKTDGCWLWRAAVEPTGYGKFKMAGRQWYAHRASYVLNVAEIPHGMVVMHKCDNPTCVNPDHLLVGTQKDNMQDKCKKGRNRMGEDSPRALITNAQAKYIKEYPKTWGSGVFLANMFGISPQHVCVIRSGKTWRHI